MISKDFKSKIHSNALLGRIVKKEQFSIQKEQISDDSIENDDLEEKRTTVISSSKNLGAYLLKCLSFKVFTYS